MKVVLTYSVLFVLSFFAAVSSATSLAPTLPISTKASKYLIDKWEKWYLLEDFNNDGVLSHYDELEFKELIRRLKLDSDQQRWMFDTRNRLWTTSLLDDRFEVSKDEFVETMKTRYEFNKTDFIETLRRFDREWLEVIDLDMDDFLTKDEFLIDRTISERRDPIKDEEFFYSHKLVNGKIFIADAVNVWLCFQTEEDPSKPDIMRDAVNSVEPYYYY